MGGKEERREGRGKGGKRGEERGGGAYMRVEGWPVKVVVHVYEESGVKTCGDEDKKQRKEKGR